MAKNTSQTLTDSGGRALSNVKPAMQNLVDSVRNTVANRAGSLTASSRSAAGTTAVGPGAQQTANSNGLSNVAGAMQGVVDAVQNAAAKKTGDAKITNVSNGRSGGGGTATYIGSDGSKKSGIANPTPGQTPQFYTDLGNLYQKAYDDQVAANNAALEEARARAQEETDALIAALGEQYAGTNRQLYRDYMERRRVMPQQLAAMGYNGGLSESSLLRLNNSYEEGLNENERARLAQEAAYNQALQQNLYDADVRTNEANQTARQNLYSQQAALQEAIYRDAQQRAATMAASGDFSEYEKLGFTRSEIAYLKQMWRRMNPTLA
jgi:hypothetical protein